MCRSDGDIKGYAERSAEVFKSIGGVVIQNRVGVTLKIPAIMTKKDADIADYAMRTLDDYKRLNAPYRQNRNQVTLLFPHAVKRREWLKARREKLAAAKEAGE